MKLAIIEIQYQKAVAKMSLSRQKLEQLISDIQTLKAGTPLTFSPDYFREPENITSPELESLANVERILEASKKKLGIAFVRLRSKAAVDDRSGRLKTIMDSTVLDAGSYHTYSEMLQNEFNFFLLDRRYNEGKKIQRLSEALDNATQRIPPDEIVNFLEVGSPFPLLSSVYFLFCFCTSPY